MSGVCVWENKKKRRGTKEQVLIQFACYALEGDGAIEQVTGLNLVLVAVVVVLREGVGGKEGKQRECVLKRKRRG